MPRRSKPEQERLTRAAAVLFATRTRDAKEIASLLDTTERTIHRWAKDPLWEEVLQYLNYEGERNFRVNPRRS